MLSISRAEVCTRMGLSLLRILLQASSYAFDCEVPKIVNFDEPRVVLTIEVGSRDDAKDVIPRIGLMKRNRTKEKST